MLTTFAHAGHDHDEPEYPTSLQDGKMYARTSSVGDGNSLVLPIAVGALGVVLIFIVLFIVLRKRSKTRRKTPR